MKRNFKQSKCHFKKGDVVEAISGTNSGKSGKVLHVYVDDQKALVEGLNIVKKHMKKTQDNPQGGIIEKEAPIHISNLKKAGGEKAAASA